MRRSAGRLALVWAVGMMLGAAPSADPQRGSRPGDGPVARPVVDAPRTIRVGVLRRGAYVVRTLPIEDYVAGVLVGEAYPDSPPALFDALAVAIRTYALKHLDRHADEGFDVCDQTHCQVLRDATEATTAAATRTTGQVLTWQGALATVYYSASCGGHTEIPSRVWPGSEDPPYLPATRDEGCGGAPEWTAEWRVDDVERALRASGFRGALKALRIQARDNSGRVTQIGVDGLRPTSISSQDFRMALGPRTFKSTAFEMRRTGAVYKFSGRGYGHGVGMCVTGATRFASLGESADDILARYYPGTTVALTGSNGNVVVRAPAAPAPAPPPPLPTPTDTGAAALTSLAARAGADLTAVLQLPASADIPLRVHASGLEYERATGRHWFTFGAFANGEIHLMPLDQLQQRGVLERVVRRELVHALLDAELGRRPHWVRDGAALYFADPQIGDTELRGPCPADAELDEPLSAGALSQAYARARACFAKQIASGRTWRDVR